MEGRAACEKNEEIPSRNFENLQDHWVKGLILRILHDGSDFTYSHFNNFGLLRFYLTPKLNGQQYPRLIA
jgi:hypothetical protein